MKNGKRAGSPYNIISLLFIKYNVTSDTYVGYEKLLNNLNLYLPRIRDIIIHFYLVRLLIDWRMIFS